MKAPAVPTIVRSVLIAGIGLSLPTLLCGIILSAVHPTCVQSTTSITLLWHALLALQPCGLLFAGLAILAVTPLCGVLAAIIGFLLHRDRVFAGIAIVLLLMTSAAFFLHR